MMNNIELEIQRNRDFNHNLILERLRETGVIALRRDKAERLSLALRSKQKQLYDF